MVAGGSVSSMDPAFTRFDATGLPSLTPLLRGRGGGIYLLELADGAEYVGQTVDFVTRMTNHIRGSGDHHEPWHDVVAVSVMNVPLDELDVWERRVIAQRRAAGAHLRNKTYNFGFLGQSAFDDVIPVKQQSHWSTGGGDFDREQYVEAAKRTPGTKPRLFQATDAARSTPLGDGTEGTVADLVVLTLALIVPQVIPDAPRLEAQYWTLSDYPRTAGGRFATLTVGTVELAYFPRQSGFDDGSPTVVFNLPRGTVLHDARPVVRHEKRDFEEALFPNGQPCWAAPTAYGIVQTDRVLSAMADLTSGDWGIVSIMRKFAIDLMRAGDSRKFARFHSPELARRIYTQALAINDLWPS